MLLKKTSLLTNQVNTLEKLNKIYSERDSLRLEEINLYENAYKESTNKYNDLNKQYLYYKKYSIISSIIIFTLGVLICR